MSLGPLGGIVGSVAGSPLSQTRGSSEERAARDAAQTEQQDELDLRTEKSSEVEGDSGTSDRDADGRRLWERTDGEPKESPEEETKEQPREAAEGTPPEDDPEGEGHLDLIA